MHTATLYVCVMCVRFWAHLLNFCRSHTPLTRTPWGHATPRLLLRFENGVNTTLHRRATGSHVWPIMFAKMRKQKKEKWSKIKFDTCKIFRTRKHDDGNDKRQPRDRFLTLIILLLLQVWAIRRMRVRTSIGINYNSGKLYASVRDW